MAAFDASLRALHAGLGERGLQVASIRFWKGSGLGIGCRNPTCHVVLEEADDRAPDGPSIGFGDFRLVMRSPRGRGDEARATLAIVRDALAANWEEGLGYWLAASNAGHRDVERSAKGALEILSAKLEPGLCFWGGWHLDDVEARKHHFELRFASTGGAQATFALGEDPSQLDEHYMATPLGALRALGFAGGDPGETERLASVLQFIIGRLMHAKLRWVDPPPSEGPDAPHEAEGPPPDDFVQADSGTNIEELYDPARPGLIGLCFGGGRQVPGQGRVLLSRFFDVWGHPSAHGVSALWDDWKSGVVVTHSGYDCTMGSGGIARSIESGHARWDCSFPDPKVPLDRNFVSGLDDVSAVMGGEDRLQEVVRSSLSRFPEMPLRVLASCDYAMIGDNVGGVCRMCAVANPDRIEYIPPHVSGFHGLDDREPWERFLDSCADAPPARGDGRPSVNLVGYEPHHSPVIGHLRELLDGIGVAVEAVILPFVSPGAEQTFRRADLTLFSPGEPVPTIFADTLERRGIRALGLPLPFGLAGTLRWLEAISEALGLGSLDPDLKARWQEETAAAIAPYRAEVEERQVRAAVIFDAGTLQELLDPRSFFGVSVLDAFDGTGCALSLVGIPLFERDSEHDPEVIAALEARGVRFRPCPAGTDPEEILAEERFDIVYCDVDDGALVKRFGSVPLDIRDLWMGLSGAVHNARHFAVASRFQLYRQYHGYLAAAQQA